MNVHDGGTGVVTVVRGLDDLCRLLRQVGILSLPLEIAGLRDGQNYFPFFVCHDNTPFTFKLRFESVCLLCLIITITALKCKTYLAAGAAWDDIL